MRTEFIKAGFDLTSSSDWISVALILAASYATHILNNLKKDNETVRRELDEKIKNEIENRNIAITNVNTQIVKLTGELAEKVNSLHYDFREGLRTERDFKVDVLKRHDEDINALYNYKSSSSNILTKIETILEKQLDPLCEEHEKYKNKHGKNNE